MTPTINVRTRLWLWYEWCNELLKIADLGRTGVEWPTDD